MRRERRKSGGAGGGAGREVGCGMGCGVECGMGCGVGCGATVVVGAVPDGICGTGGSATVGGSDAVVSGAPSSSSSESGRT